MCIHKTSGVAAGMMVVTAALGMYSLWTPSWTVEAPSGTPRSNNTHLLNTSRSCADVAELQGEDPCGICTQTGRCGWCGAFGKCLEGDVWGPKLVAPGGGTGGGNAPSGFQCPDTWIYDRAQCTKGTQRQFGILYYCDVSSGASQCGRARSGDDSVCKRWERRYDMLLRIIQNELTGGSSSSGAGNPTAGRRSLLRGQRGGSGSASSRLLAVGDRAKDDCYRLEPSDVDQCKAMEAYCGAPGNLAATFALMVGLLSIVAMVIAVIVGGEMLGRAARLRVAPDVLVLRLRLLAVISGGLCIGGSVVGIMCMSTWTTINSALAIAYDNDGCSGPACPHLGQSFWSFVCAITLMFFSGMMMMMQPASLATVQTKLEELQGHRKSSVQQLNPWQVEALGQEMEQEQQEAFEHTQDMEQARGMEASREAAEAELEARLAMEQQAEAMFAAELAAAVADSTRPQEEIRPDDEYVEQARQLAPKSALDKMRLKVGADAFAAAGKDAHSARNVGKGKARRASLKRAEAALAEAVASERGMTTARNRWSQAAKGVLATGANGGKGKVKKARKKSALRRKDSAASMASSIASAATIDDDDDGVSVGTSEQQNDDDSASVVSAAQSVSSSISAVSSAASSASRTRKVRKKSRQLVSKPTEATGGDSAQSPESKPGQESGVASGTAGEATGKKKKVRKKSSVTAKAAVAAAAATAAAGMVDNTNAADKVSDDDNISVVSDAPSSVSAASSATGKKKKVRKKSQRAVTKAAGGTGAPAAAAVAQGSDADGGTGNGGGGDADDTASVASSASAVSTGSKGRKKRRKSSRMLNAGSKGEHAASAAGSMNANEGANASGDGGGDSDSDRNTNAAATTAVATTKLDGGKDKGQSEIAIATAKPKKKIRKKSKSSQQVE